MLDVPRPLQLFFLDHCRPLQLYLRSCKDLTNEPELENKEKHQTNLKKMHFQDEKPKPQPPEPLLNPSFIGGLTVEGVALESRA